MVMLQIKRLLGHAFVHPIQVVDLQLTEIAHHMRAKSNSNRMIFFFPLSHYKGKSPFSISTYMEELLQQIDFPPFYVEREMRCLLFLLVIGEKLLGIEKK